MSTFHELLNSVKDAGPPALLFILQMEIEDKFFSDQGDLNKEDQVNYPRLKPVGLKGAGSQSANGDVRVD